MSELTQALLWQLQPERSLPKPIFRNQEWIWRSAQNQCPWSLIFPKIDGKADPRTGSTPSTSWFFQTLLISQSNRVILPVFKFASASPVCPHQTSQTLSNFAPYSWQVTSPQMIILLRKHSLTGSTVSPCYWSNTEQLQSELEWFLTRRKLVEQSLELRLVAMLSDAAAWRQCLGDKREEERRMQVRIRFMKGSIDRGRGSWWNDCTVGHGRKTGLTCRFPLSEWNFFLFMSWIRIRIGIWFGILLATEHGHT